MKGKIFLSLLIQNSSAPNISKFDLESSQILLMKSGKFAQVSVNLHVQSKKVVTQNGSIKILIKKIRSRL